MKVKTWLCALLISLMAGVAWAGPAAEITHLSGILSVKRTDGTSKVLAVKSQVNEGDVLTTEAESYVRLKFLDGAEVVLRPNSQFKVEAYRYEESKPAEDNVFFSLLKGGLRAVTGAVGKRNKEKIAYQTPTATIGIRGTHFGAQYCQGDCGELKTPGGSTPRDGLHVDVVAGRIAIANQAGTVEFGAGEFAYVKDSNTLPIPVPGSDSFRVTMPSAIAINRGVGDGIGSNCAGDCMIE